MCKGSIVITPSNKPNNVKISKDYIFTKPFQLTVYCPGVNHSPPRAGAGRGSGVFGQWRWWCRCGGLTAHAQTREDRHQVVWAISTWALSTMDVTLYTAQDFSDASDRRYQSSKYQVTQQALRALVWLVSGRGAKSQPCFPRRLFVRRGNSYTLRYPTPPHQLCWIFYL